MPSMGYALCFGISLLTQTIGGEARDLIYETGFEETEGYSMEKDLIGQSGWIGYVSGGDFLETNHDASTGLLELMNEPGNQRAYIGFAPPAHSLPIEFLSVIMPVDYVPAMDVADQVLRFDVEMGIVDSLNNQRDNFRWSAYNSEGFRLFSLDFDNETKFIAYSLDDEQGLRDTDYVFENDIIYDLTILMDFPRNRWEASIGTTALFEAQPITTIGSELNLSDMDAVWSIYDPDSPGDNFLVFDNYKLELIKSSPVPLVLQPIGLSIEGFFTLRIAGPAGSICDLEYSEDLVHWKPAVSGVQIGVDGVTQWSDSTSKATAIRYYRATTVGL
jgi:hypothetical protein